MRKCFDKERNNTEIVIIPLRTAVIHCGNVPDSFVLAEVQQLRERYSPRKKWKLHDRRVQRCLRDGAE